MPADCYSLVKGKLIRVTKLGPCGEPIMDAGDPTWPVHAVMKCFASVEYSPEVDEGNEILEKDANDDICVTEPPCPTNKWVNVTATLKRVDPELVSLLTGFPLVLDADGKATGFRVRGKINCESPVALETWTGTDRAARCSGGATVKPRFGYLLASMLTNANLGDLSITNGLANVVLTGKAIYGGQWGTGPYPVYETADGGVAPLTDPIGPDDLIHVDLTTLPPPPVTCGVVPRPPDFTLTPAAGGLVTLEMTYIPPGPPPHTATVHWGDGATDPAPAAVGPPGIGHTYGSVKTWQVRVVDDVTGAVRLKTVTSLA